MLLSISDSTSSIMRSVCRFMSPFHERWHAMSSSYWFFHHCILFRLYWLPSDYIQCEVGSFHNRAVHNFSIWGGNVISWSREHGCPAVVHFRGVWGHAPPGNFDNFRCSEVLTGAFWGMQRSTQTFLRKGSSSKSSLLAELLEQWKPSPLARNYIHYYLCLYIGARRKQIWNVEVKLCHANRCYENGK